VATVRAFEIEGVKIWFWSDDHDPPHFHAKKSGEWEMKVHFLLDRSAMIEVEWIETKPSGRAVRNLGALAEQHRVELLEQWGEVQDN